MTAFSRSDVDWYTKAILHQGILYVNKKKSRKALSAIGQSSSQRVALTASFVNGIPDEKDLRKLKGKNYRYYQKKGEITNTKAFKEWFGKSKLVDENGKPFGNTFRHSFGLRRCAQKFSACKRSKR